MSSVWYPEQALVKSCSPNFSQGLTSRDLGPADPREADRQHQLYTEALQTAGLQLTVLPEDQHPDSCFVEDLAVVGADFALLTRPGHPDRLKEAAPVHQAIRSLLPELAVYEMEPGEALAGGDVLMMDDCCYVGLSERTNSEGRRRLAEVVGRHGLECRALGTEGLLHLKTGVTRLNSETVIAHRLFSRAFEEYGYRVVLVGDQEWHAANVVAVGKQVVMPAGHPRVEDALAGLGLEPLAVPLTEFAKQDGGASCLSILLPGRGK